VTSTLVLAGSFAMYAAPAHAAAPPPINVHSDQVHCDTLIGGIKFGTALALSGTPGVNSNPITVKATVDGCTDTSNANVSVAASKFSAPLTANFAADNNKCNPDGSPATPIGSGSSPCHGQFGGSKTVVAGDYPTDQGGGFGANSCLGLQGNSDTRPGHGVTGTATVTWKSAPGTAKLVLADLVSPAVSTVTIAQTGGIQFPSPFLGAGSSTYGEFQVGSEFGTLDETVSGAFVGPSGNGAASTFQGMTGQSSGAIGSMCFGKGIKLLNFGIGDIKTG